MPLTQSIQGYKPYTKKEKNHHISSQAAVHRVCTGILIKCAYLSNLACAVTACYYLTI